MTKRRAKTAPGVLIRRWREEAGLTQRELAERVGQIDAAGVSKIETGATKLGRARARRFARALDKDPSQLLPVSEPSATSQDVLDLLESIEGERQIALQALADSLVSIGVQLANIEVLLQRRGFGEQAT